MHLISWNVNGRVTRLGAQSHALHQRHPDLVALQEVVPTTVAQWRAHLAHSGLVYCVDSFALQDQAPTERYRRYGELLASRCPLTPLPPTAFAVPWPERLLSAVLAARGGHRARTTGMPPGVSHGWLVESWKPCIAALRALRPVPVSYVGSEHPASKSTDGHMTTLGQVITANGRVRAWKTKRIVVACRYG